MIRQSAVALAAAIALATAATPAAGTIAWTPLGTVANASDPSVWELEVFDVTALIAGAGSAVLSFELRNDAPAALYTASATVTAVEFGVEGADYFARLAYAAGGNSSHWRDMRLALDGSLLRDQYGAFDDHRGDEYLGTAYQGGYPANNILGETGPDAGIYRLSAPAAGIPEPATGVVLAGALAALAARARARRQ
ncbi:MAG: hypothetical protein JNK67_27075 [Alphaproteobacteria bacterium]|nr:hypothetical protein [Alphaproteobacteria bacterium]